MKKKEFMKMVLFSAVAVCLTSCAMNPKVTADLMGTYPQRSADQVVIYEEGDTVPANATVVGKVKVTDGGMRRNDWNFGLSLWKCAGTGCEEDG